MAPAVRSLAPRRVLFAAAAVTALLLGMVAAATEEPAAPEAAQAQCDAETGDCAATPPAPSEGESEGATVEDNPAATNRTGRVKGEPITLQDLGFWRVGIVVVMFGGVVLWILCTIKFAFDGSLAARLAMWGFLPEAYAAISVSSVCALLRLKKHETPVIVLRNCVTDKGALELAEAVRLYNKTACLEAVEFPHNPKLGEKGARVLAEMAVSAEMQEFDLSYNPQLRGAVVDCILPLLPAKTSKVQTLRLADTGIDHAAAKKLAANVSMSGVRTLDLSVNPLSGAGEILGEIMEAPFLEEIMLAGCALTPEDVGAVAEQLPFTSIKSIQLAGNRFGAAGLKALCKHLPSSQIEELGLEGNNLELEDLTMLGEAWVKRPFARVKLNGNRVTNEEIGNFVNTLRSMT